MCQHLSCSCAVGEQVSATSSLSTRPAALAPGHPGLPRRRIDAGPRCHLDTGQGVRIRYGPNPPVIVKHTHKKYYQGGENPDCFAPLETAANSPFFLLHCRWRAGWTTYHVSAILQGGTAAVFFFKFFLVSVGNCVGCLPNGSVFFVLFLCFLPVGSRTIEMEIHGITVCGREHWRWGNRGSTSLCRT